MGNSRFIGVPGSVIGAFGLALAAGLAPMPAHAQQPVAPVDAPADAPPDAPADPIAALLLETQNEPSEISDNSPEELSPAATETATAETGAEPAPAPMAAPLMWRISDADSIYWLFGTFHILPPDLEWRTAALDHALEQADIYYFEVEGDAPDAQSRTLQILMLQGFNEPGKTLTQMLDEENAQKLREITAELSLPIAAIDPMRPWQAFLALSVQFIIDQGFTPGAGADNVLMAEARGRGKDLVFFESIEEQLGFFTGLPEAVEKDMLVFTLQNWDNQKAEFDELFTAWRHGDVDVIDQSMNDTMRKDAPEVYEVLIVKRNITWADKIASDMRGGAGKGLVAVGAAHMTGADNSLPALLAARGFTVERYKNAPLDEATTGASPAVNDAVNDNEPAEASPDL